MARRAADAAVPHRGPRHAPTPAARTVGETVAAVAPRTDVRSSTPPPVLGSPERVIARGSVPETEPVSVPNPEVRRVVPNYPPPVLGPPELPARP